MQTILRGEVKAESQYVVFLVYGAIFGKSGLPSGRFTEYRAFKRFGWRLYKLHIFKFSSTNVKHRS